MIDIALYQPEIPPNTGNIIRLCANTGARLHLIHPLGFRLDERSVRRAGLDYHEMAGVTEHRNTEAFLEAIGGARLWAFTTRGERRHDQAAYSDGDVLLFGPETRGLPLPLLERLPKEHWLRLPMRSGSRSLNLSNAAAVACYEAWRQLGFSGS